MHIEDVEQICDYLISLGIAPPRLSWSRSYGHWADQVMDAYEDSLLLMEDSL